MSEPMRCYIPTSEAAALTGWSRATLLSYCKRGLVRRHMINRRVVRWHRGDLLRLIGELPAEQQQEGGARA